jgi:hypothetical protein
LVQQATAIRCVDNLVIEKIGRQVVPKPPYAMGPTAILEEVLVVRLFIKLLLVASTELLLNFLLGHVAPSRTSVGLQCSRRNRLAGLQV